MGRILQAIDELGIAESTFVIYMSDNGGGRRSPLRGGKGSLYEGGLRVPLIIRGPGVEADSWCHTPVVGYDFYPTFCEWAGVPDDELPDDLEGGSLVELLGHGGLGEVKRSQPALIFHFPHYQSDDGPHSAIRLGDLKLLKFYEDDRLALFDLSDDISEQSDLSQQRGDEVDRLHGLLNDYLTSADAQMPEPNPQYDPQQPPSGRHRGGGHGGPVDQRRTPRIPRRR